MTLRLRSGQALRLRSRLRRERADHTLAPTELVHEAFLKLGHGDDASWESRAHFFGTAARAMRQVLIEAAASGTLKIMATDLDLQVVESMAAVSVEAPGAITVSAHLLFDIARKLPDGSQVSLETADNRMTVKAGRSRFSLPTLPRDDFPVIVEGDLPTSFELPARTLAELVVRDLADERRL